MKRRDFLKRAAATLGAASVFPLVASAMASGPVAAITVPPVLTSDAAAWAAAYRHQQFSLGIKITEEALQDDVYGFWLKE